ncbi:MAG: hypothetical protein C5B50_25665 [Verrucomicrobia bacterium]|nr:MAG: hypothetical protein C5B50_25665 [Verrucomicrobiota bacterium]
MKTDGWLLLLYALPTRRNAERVNLWRKLRKFGAVQLKTSGYVLPEAPPHLERFQWLAAQIQDAGGEATLIRVREIEGVSNQQMIAMFNDARAADYKTIISACRTALSKTAKKKSAKTASTLSELKERLADVRKTDYFDSPAAHDAEMLLHRLEKMLSPDGTPPAVKRLQANDFRGRTWLTRPRPGIDRAASAWLIRRFIDPKARFIFGMDPSNRPKALPFDMARAEFSHQGDDCTFETLIKRFGIKDQKIFQIAEMVHDADLEDDKFHRTECIAIDLVLTGWARLPITDAELLERGIQCFEGLYKGLGK